MIMNVVFYSGPSASQMTIVFAIVSVVHIVITFIFAALAILIAGIFTKKKIAYWPVFLFAFLAGEIWLLPMRYDYTGEGMVPVAYPIVMIIGFTCGILFSLLKKSKSGNTPS